MMQEGIQKKSVLDAALDKEEFNTIDILHFVNEMKKAIFYIIKKITHENDRIWVKTFILPAIIQIHRTVEAYERSKGAKIK